MIRKDDVICIILEGRHMKHLEAIAADDRITTSEVIRRIIEKDRRRTEPIIVGNNVLRIGSRKDRVQRTIRVDSLHLEHLKRSNQSYSDTVAYLIEANIADKSQGKS